ncbi:hypothetical protein IJ541_05625 [bacterium]|nr:hypothetical protein [bacterium]
MGIEFDSNLSLQGLRGNGKTSKSVKFKTQEFNMAEAVKNLNRSTNSNDINQIVYDDKTLGSLLDKFVGKDETAKSAKKEEDYKPAMPRTDEEKEQERVETQKDFEAGKARHRDAQKKLDGCRASNGMTYKEARTIYNQMREKYTDKKTGKFDEFDMSNKEYEVYQRAINAMKEIERNNSSLVEEAAGKSSWIYSM